MRAAGHPYPILSEVEMHTILSSAFRILSEMGMEMQNSVLLQHIAQFGWEVDISSSRIRFPTNLVKTFLQDTADYDWSQHQPQVSSTAGVYHGRYLDPESQKFVQWNPEILANYFSLAKSLPHIDTATMLGCRLPLPPTLEPLYERYYCWKYGARECGSIYLDALCPYIYEMYEAYACHLDTTINNVFRAMVFVIPHLKLGYHEAAQVQYFWERGLQVHIGGGMPSMGATAPVTFAGAITLNLAEQIALAIIESALYGTNTFGIGSSISVMDMRTSIHPFGRPEMAIANLMTAQIARYLGVTFNGHAGLTDAKYPSAEVGFQKMMTAVPTLLIGGSLWLDAGLLSIDEVYSPLQMILDNEMLSALKHFTREFTVDESSLGLETILQVGPGGHYLDQVHTVEYFREEHWQPNIWTRQMLQPWIDDGSRMDIEIARDIYYDLTANAKKSLPRMSETFESDLNKIIKRAGALL